MRHPLFFMVTAPARRENADRINMLKNNIVPVFMIMSFYDLQCYCLENKALVLVAHIERDTVVHQEIAGEYFSFQGVES